MIKVKKGRFPPDVDYLKKAYTFVSSDLRFNCRKETTWMIPWIGGDVRDVIFDALDFVDDEEFHDWA